ncbi:urease accessory protein UreD [Jatrophihabitans sp. YIM 134969]
MRARTAVVVDPGGRLAEVRCAPPLTVRQLRSRDRDVCALCVVGTAAGPLPGDDLALSLGIRAGARATLQATGAQIAQGGRPGAPPALVRYDVEVAHGAHLDADPGALVVARNADVEVDVRIELAAGAAVVWRETVVLGRTGEPPGRVRLRWDVRRDGAPLLRQDLDLADPALRDWSGVTGGAKVLTTVLHVAPGLAARTVVRSPTDVTQRLAAHATVTTTLEPERRR